MLSKSISSDSKPSPALDRQKGKHSSRFYLSQEGETTVKQALQDQSVHHPGEKVEPKVLDIYEVFQELSVPRTP